MDPRVARLQERARDHWQNSPNHHAGGLLADRLRRRSVAAGFVAVFATLSASLRGKLMILREAALLVGALEPPFEAISRCSLSSMPAKPRPWFVIALLQVLRGNAPVDEPVLSDVVFSGRKAGRASYAARVPPRADCGFATFADNPICAVVPAEIKLARIAEAVARVRNGGQIALAFYPIVSYFKM
ncbi:MAG: hypothetical protein J0G95_12265 [Rhizobiales bacterium]|nr:hypothetical protein [Hyphomicrobiales bacterium]